MEIYHELRQLRVCSNAAPADQKTHSAAANRGEKESGSLVLSGHDLPVGLQGHLLAETAIIQELVGGGCMHAAAARGLAAGASVINNTRITATVILLPLMKVIRLSLALSRQGSAEVGVGPEPFVALHCKIWQTLN